MEGELPSNEILEEDLGMEGELPSSEILEEDVEVVHTEGNTENGKIVTPICGMLFPDLDMIYDYWKTYASQMGFPVRKRSSKRGSDGMPKFVCFECSLAGKLKSQTSNPLKPQPNTRLGCPVKLFATCDPDGQWRITSFIIDHNHQLCPSKARLFRNNRFINPSAKRRLEINDRAGIRVNKSFNSMVVEAGGHENMTYTEKDARNEIDKERKLRLGEGDATAILNYFTNMQTETKDFFFSMDLGEDGQLKNVFWADKRSRETYKEFGEVITFDTTYLTNKYDISFAPFFGVNHHGQSVLLGCGLISKEDTKTFCWLFRTWLLCISDVAPNAIITDQDRAMQNAIEIIFPNARHRWCLWHIMRKMPEKLGCYKDKHSITFHLQGAVYDSQNPTEFEGIWMTVVDTYDLHANKWLNGLYNERHRWVPCFLKSSFLAGMSTTQRSESINAFFDGYVNSKTTLKQFVEQYKNALASKVEKEKQADYRSLTQIVPCATVFEMEKQFQEVYTISKFKEFQTEVLGKLYCELISVKDNSVGSEFYIEEDIMIVEVVRKRVSFTVLVNRDNRDIKCSCQKFEFRGILCRHAIAAFLRSFGNAKLPEKYIFKRWRKDVTRVHTRVKINYNGWIATDEHKRYDSLCSSFTRVADLAAEDEEKFQDVMEVIEHTVNRLSSMSIHTPKTNVNMTSSHSKHSNLKEVIHIGDPIVTKKKGRPPETRKQSIGEVKTRQCAAKKQKLTNKKEPHNIDGSSLSHVHKVTPSISSTHESIYIPETNSTQESVYDQGPTYASLFWISLIGIPKSFMAIQ